MARKAKETAKYFSHDSNARNSDKLIRLRMRHSAAGYGVYFMILERLREEPDYMSIKDYNIIAFDLRVDAALVKSVIEDFGLFVFTEDGKYFYSESFSKRMGIMDETRKKRSEAGKSGMASRWSKDKNSNDDITELQQNDNNVITKGGEKDNKKNKQKEKELKETSPKGESKKAADATFSPAHENQVADFETDPGCSPKSHEEERKSCAKKKEEHDAELTERRMQKFYESLVPYVEQYGRQMVRDFYDYWTERNKSGTKMRFEMEKTWDTARRLVRWDMNNNNFKKRDYGCENQKRFGNTAPDDFKGKGSTKL